MLRRIPFFQDIQRVDSVRRTGTLRLKLAHAHSGVPRDRRAEHRRTVRERRRRQSGLMGRMRGRQEDDAFHTAGFQQIIRESDVPEMNGIERAAEDGCQVFFTHSGRFFRVLFCGNLSCALAFGQTRAYFKSTL